MDEEIGHGDRATVMLDHLPGPAFGWISALRACIRSIICIPA